MWQWKHIAKYIKAITVFTECSEEMERNINDLAFRVYLNMLYILTITSQLALVTHMQNWLLLIIFLFIFNVLFLVLFLRH